MFLVPKHEHLRSTMYSRMEQLAARLAKCYEAVASAIEMPELKLAHIRHNVFTPYMARLQELLQITGKAIHELCASINAIGEQFYEFLCSVHNTHVTGFCSK